MDIADLWQCIVTGMPQAEIITFLYRTVEEVGEKLVELYPQR